MKSIFTDELVSVDEAAAALAVSPKTIRKWVSEGKLAGRKLGYRTLRIPASAIENIIEASASNNSRSIRDAAK